MDYKLYQKSTPLSVKEIKKFIDCLEAEPYYFSCTKSDDLISLREYVLSLYEKEKEYRKRIQKPMNRLVDKNHWIHDISPAFSLLGISYVLTGKGAPNIRISSDNGPVKMVSFDFDSNTYFKKNKFINRVKVMENSLDELSEIKEITEEFDFKQERDGMLSASNHFIVFPINFERIEVRTNSHPLVSIYPHDEEVDFHRVARVEFNNKQYSYTRVLEKLYVKK